LRLLRGLLGGRGLVGLVRAVGAALLATLFVATTIALLAATTAVTATFSTAFTATAITAPVTLARVAVATAAARLRRCRFGTEQAAEQAGEETGLRSGSGNRCRCCLLLDLARLTRGRRLRRLHVAHRRQGRD